MGIAKAVLFLAGGGSASDPDKALVASIKNEHILNTKYITKD